MFSLFSEASKWRQEEDERVEKAKIAAKASTCSQASPSGPGPHFMRDPAGNVFNYDKFCEGFQAPLKQPN
jgi:hypothetical protein